MLSLQDLEKLRCNRCKECHDHRHGSPDGPEAIEAMSKLPGQQAQPQMRVSLHGSWGTSQYKVIHAAA